jgi:outer membrane lipoprotein-sorting protein
MTSKHTFAFLLIIIFSVIANAAENPAQELLEQLSGSYLAMIPFKLDFELINYLDQENYQSAAGSYFMTSDNRFRVDFAEQEVIFDGQWLWSYDRTNDQVIIEPLDPQLAVF